MERPLLVYLYIYIYIYVCVCVYSCRLYFFLCTYGQLGGPAHISIVLSNMLPPYVLPQSRNIFSLHGCTFKLRKGEKKITRDMSIAAGSDLLLYGIRGSGGSSGSSSSKSSSKSKDNGGYS